MVWKKRSWVLPVLIGILLGLLAGTVAWRLRAEEAPAPAPSALPPAETAPPTPSPDPVPTPGPSSLPEPPVGDVLTAFAQSQPGRWSLVWMALPEGRPVYVASDGEPMVSASLIKLFIMGAVYEQIEAGTLDREEVFPKLSIMITVSDNAAANQLIRLLGGGDAERGMAAVNDWCARQGYPNTRLNRLMLEENGLQNTTNAADCAAFLAAVYRGTCVSPAASAEMLALLLGQTVNDRLPAALPEGTPVAHKTGDLFALSCGDVGIVYSPGGDYILCVICNDPPRDNAARDAIAQLSAEIYGLVNPPQEP